MRKYIGHGAVAVAELLLFLGAFVVKYFTGKKMGMARFVIFKNQAWEKAYPLEQWKLFSILVLAALLVLAMLLLSKKRKILTRCDLFEGALSVLMTGYSLYFTLTNSVTELRPYYWMSPMFALAALLQLIRMLVILQKCREQ